MTSTIEKRSEGYTIAKRDGRLVPFRRERIQNALEAAVRDTKEIDQSEPLTEHLVYLIKKIVDLVEEEG